MDLLVQVSKNRGNVKNHQKNSIYTIIAWPPKVQKPLRSTTNINFERKTWVKFTWKIILSFIWVYSSALRDHYIVRWKTNKQAVGTHSRWHHSSLIEVKITVTRGTLTVFCLIQGDRFTQGDCLIQADYLIQGEHLTQGDHLIQCCLTQGDRLMQCWLTQFYCTIIKTR